MSRRGGGVWCWTTSRLSSRARSRTRLSTSRSSANAAAANAAHQHQGVGRLSGNRAIVRQLFEDMLARLPLVGTSAGPCTSTSSRSSQPNRRRFHVFVDVRTAAVGIEHGSVGGRACRPPGRRDRQGRLISAQAVAASSGAGLQLLTVPAASGGQGCRGCMQQLSARSALEAIFVDGDRLPGSACVCEHLYAAAPREDRSLACAAPQVARRLGAHHVGERRLSRPFLGAGQPGGLPATAG